MTAALKKPEPRAPVSVAVCVPSQSHMAIEFVHSLVQMMTYTISVFGEQDRLGLSFGESTYIHRNRNDLAKGAMEDDATHLFWLDDDMQFPVDALVRLLRRKLPFVGCNYVQRGGAAKPIAISTTGVVGGEPALLYTEAGDERVVPVEGMGFGAVLIERRVFEAVPQPWFENYWSAVGQRWIGEDVDFCMKAKRAGFQPMVDQALSQEIGHVGKFVYKHIHGRAVRELAAAAPEKTA
jgi:hypothetical protein